MDDKQIPQIPQVHLGCISEFTDGKTYLVSIQLRNGFQQTVSVKSVSLVSRIIEANPGASIIVTEVVNYK